MAHARLFEPAAAATVLLAASFIISSPIAVATDGPGDPLWLSASPEVRQLAQAPLKPDEFDATLALLQDGKRNSADRQLLLAQLYDLSREATTEERLRLLKTADQIAAARSADPPLQAYALHTSALLRILMKEVGELAEVAAGEQTSRLLSTAADESQSLDLRAAAIEALGWLQPTGSVAVLSAVLKDPNNIDRPELARGACLSLLRTAKHDALPIIRSALERTNTESVFRTATYCLGQLPSVEALQALVASADRFPTTGAVGFALVDMDEVICDTLASPTSPALHSAIAATRYFWREDQHARFTPLLRDLLATAPEAAIPQIVDRLVDEASELSFEAEKAELRLLLAAMPDDIDLPDRIAHIEARLAADLRTDISTSSVLAPAQAQPSVFVANENGNMAAQEYGDALYWYLSWSDWGLPDYNHAALFSGTSVDGRHRKIEAGKVGFRNSSAVCRD